MHPGPTSHEYVSDGSHHQHQRCGCYKCLRGSSSLEELPRSLPHMIPGDLENTATATIIPCIDSLSFIPYLLWCTCRSSLCSVALPGLLDQWHCAVECRQELGGCVWGRRSPEVNSVLGAPCGLPQHVEKKFRPPTDAQSDELLGLEYLFQLSKGETGAFSIDGLVKDRPAPKDDLYQPGVDDPWLQAPQASILYCSFELLVSYTLVF